MAFSCCIYLVLILMHKRRIATLVQATSLTWESGPLLELSMYFKLIQWGSELWTRPVFKWSNSVLSENGPLTKPWPGNRIVIQTTIWLPTIIQTTIWLLDYHSNNWHLITRLGVVSYLNGSVVWMFVIGIGIPIVIHISSNKPLFVEIIVNYAILQYLKSWFVKKIILFLFQIQPVFVELFQVYCLANLMDNKTFSPIKISLLNCYFCKRL